MEKDKNVKAVDAVRLAVKHTLAQRYEDELRSREPWLTYSNLQEQLAWIETLSRMFFRDHQNELTLTTENETISAVDALALTKQFLEEYSRVLLVMKGPAWSASDILNDLLAFLAERDYHFKLTS